MIVRLTDVLQTLALPAEAQLARPPDLVARTGELALDFADALLLVGDCPQIRLTQDQQAALGAVEALLDRLGATSDTMLRTDAALRDSPEWAAIRSLARAALAALGQPLRTLPPG